MADIAENLLIMVLTVVFLLGGGYLLLVVLDIWFKMKCGSREHDGLADLLASVHIDASRKQDPGEQGENASGEALEQDLEHPNPSS